MTVYHIGKPCEKCNRRLLFGWEAEMLTICKECRDRAEKKRRESSGKTVDRWFFTGMVVVTAVLMLSVWLFK